MDAEGLLAGLNDEQRRAALATTGPVCILAGAGSGKTTTITRRIALQVATGAFAPAEILAVTFTDRAAGELRARLADLGVQGVVARTFHAAALAQLRALAPEPPGRLLPSKALLVRQIANGLPGAYRFRAAGDLATEIERAKNRGVVPAGYLADLGDHEPPLPPDLMARVFREYERRKDGAGLVDFEDLLARAVDLYETSEQAASRFRARYRAFTVDEYQDVNLLQQRLLELWLGDRSDLCVVGDDYQSIYSFTGATPRYLLEAPQRFPQVTVARLEANYRSTPQVLAFANRLVPRLGGAEKRLRAVRGDGPEPELHLLADAGAEARFVAQRVEQLAGAGVPLAETAVLYRTNARSEAFEEALAAAGIPYQVRGGAFLERPAARRLLRLLERAPQEHAGAAVRRAATEEGWVTPVPEGLGEQEETRQRDLGRLVALAESFGGGTGTVAELVADLQARFGEEGVARGVHLLTLHRAKGLEFDAVFLPRLEEGELPIRQARTPALVAEERRLLYVGLTRARGHLVLSRTAERAASRFLAELSLAGRREPARAGSAAGTAPADPLLAALRAWRRRRARADGVPAYIVFPDRTLEAIAVAAPASELELAEVSGVGPAKLARYGGDVLALVADPAGTQD